MEFHQKLKRKIQVKADSIGAIADICCGHGVLVQNRESLGAIRWRWFRSPY